MSDVKFIVTVENGGTTWFLRSTIWTSEFDRADKYADRVAAQAAFDKAKQFMAAKIRKAAVILPAPEPRS